MKKSEVLNLSDNELDTLISIKGTKFDRRRKLTDKQVDGIKKYFKKGFTLTKLANRYNVSLVTIKYHVDPKYKNRVNYNRTFYPNYTPIIYSQSLQERANYKRSLITSRKIKVGDYVK